MVSETTVILGSAGLYLLALVIIGWYSRSRSKKTKEDYFLASRTFGTVAFFFGLLATMLSGLAVIGIPGIAYNLGFGMFGYLYGFLTVLAPVMIATVGYRIWIAGKKWGHITPAQVMNHRFETKYLGLFVMGLMIFWTLPVFVIGLMSGGIVMNTLTSGAIPYFVGAGAVGIIVFFYVVVGGMRGATWTNIMQGGLMITLMLGLVAYFGLEFGGFSAATKALIDANPALITRANLPPFSTLTWFSFALLPGIHFVMNPRLFIRLFTALSLPVYKRTVLLFPLGISLIGAPAVLIGAWGRGQIPGLSPAAADTIFPMLVGNYLPPLLVGLALVLILSAVMSSLDAQTLTVSTMLSEDVVAAVSGEMSELKEVRITQGIIGALILLSYIVSLMRPDTLFDLGVLSFQGIALITYPFAISFYWKGATAKGVWAALATGFIGLLLFKTGVLPGWLTFGFMEHIPLFVAEIIVMHTVSWKTARPSPERIDTFFDAFKGVW